MPSPALPPLPVFQRRVLLAGLMATPTLQAAACHRVRIPLAPGGLLVREEGGQARGVVVDLIDAMRRRLTCEVVAELLPQARLIRSFYETFEADVLIPGSPLSFDGHTPHFVPLFQVQAHWVGLADNPSGPAAGQTVWAPSGTCVLARQVTYGADFDRLVGRLDAQGRVTWVRDVGTALRMVEARRVDFTLLSPTVGYSYLGPTRAKAFRFRALHSLKPLVTGAAVSRRSMPPEAQDEVVTALRTLVRDGEVGRAFARHFPPAILAQEPLALPKT